MLSYEYEEKFSSSKNNFRTKTFLFPCLSFCLRFLVLRFILMPEKRKWIVMEQLLLKMAKQLDGLDESSLENLWEKYAQIVNNFERIAHCVLKS